MKALYGTLSFPSSVLLCGEYAILEAENLGLAIALPPRVELRISPASSLNCYGYFSGKEHREPALAECCREVLRARSGSLDLSGRIDVDANALYRGGKKRGLGSSAAAALGFVAGLYALRGLDPFRHQDEIYALSLEAHRSFQGGGSGYDVTTSLFGGVGLFRSGAIPGWDAQKEFWDVELVDGKGQTSTRNAIQSCKTWMHKHREEWKTFVAQSNALLRDLVCAGDWASWSAHFCRAKELYAELGEAIGVPARWDDDALSKAVGAGSELGVRIQKKRLTRLTEGMQQEVPLVEEG